MISGKKSNADKAGHDDFKNDGDETFNAEKSCSNEAPKRLVLIKMEAIKGFFYRFIASLHQGKSI
jgi:hypothetical protein